MFVLKIESFFDTVVENFLNYRTVLLKLAFFTGSACVFLRLNSREEQTCILKFISFSNKKLSMGSCLWFETYMGGVANI